MQDPIIPSEESGSHMVTLYVGDLHMDVDESILFKKFSTIGPLSSIRLCRDATTKCSLGYAYVNFQHSEDAARAKENLNFDLIKGRAIRIMWSQRDPSLRKSGKGNIFIKNLHPEIDNKAMFDTFSAFGDILSCKIVEDEDGGSKGYGFVHFETEEAASKAISTVNGMLLNGQKVFVGPFIRQEERQKLVGNANHKQFTNLYVKQLPKDFNEACLRFMFEIYGRITSLKIMCDEEGISKGFGFVCFDNPESAETAMQQLNGSQVLGEKPLYVSRAQNKFKRQRELKLHFENLKRKQTNIYIKNLDDSIDDDRLRDLFSSFGTIASAKVMRMDDCSKDFGFVCFSSAEEAAEAVQKMNGKLVGNRPFHVALAQTREEPHANFGAQYPANTFDQFVQPGATDGSFVPDSRNFNNPGPSYCYSPYLNTWCDHFPPLSPHQWPLWGDCGNVPLQQLPFPPQQFFPVVGNWAGPCGYPADMVHFPQGLGTDNAAPVPTQSPELSTSATSPDEAQEPEMLTLEEILYLFVQNINPGLACKITGMLLELDEAELVPLLEDEESLEKMVEEAVSALREHHGEDATMKQG